MAGDVFRFGLIGCGAISAKHIDACEHLQNAAIVAVADRDERRAELAATRLSGEAYVDYRYLLDRADIDGVIIATPSGMHARMTLDAMHADKHVLVEKPIALSIEDADLMIGTADRLGKSLGVVYHNRFNEASLLLKQAVREGALGQLTWGSTSVRWYRPQQYYSDSGWRGTAAMDGGVLMNQAIHHIDLLLWLMGDVESFQGFRATLGHEMEAEDAAVMSLMFRNGALGSIDATTCAVPKNLEETVTIIGDRGSVVMGGTSLNSFREWRVGDCRVPDIRQDLPKWGGHHAVIGDFVRSVHEGREPAVSGIEGKRALELIVNAYSTMPFLTKAAKGNATSEGTEEM